MATLVAVDAVRDHITTNGIEAFRLEGFAIVVLCEKSDRPARRVIDTQLLALLRVFVVETTNACG